MNGVINRQIDPGIPTRRSSAAIFHGGIKKNINQKNPVDKMSKTDSRTV